MASKPLYTHDVLEVDHDQDTSSGIQTPIEQARRPRIGYKSNRPHLSHDLGLGNLARRYEDLDHVDYVRPAAIFRRDDEVYREFLVQRNAKDSPAKPQTKSPASTKKSGGGRESSKSASKGGGKSKSSQKGSKQKGSKGGKSSKGGKKSGGKSGKKDGKGKNGKNGKNGKSKGKKDGKGKGGKSKDGKNGGKKDGKNAFQNYLKNMRQQQAADGCSPTGFCLPKVQ